MTEKQSRWSPRLHSLRLGSQLVCSSKFEKRLWVCTHPVRLERFYHSLLAVNASASLYFSKRFFFLSKRCRCLKSGSYSHAESHGPKSILKFYERLLLEEISNKNFSFSTPINSFDLFPFSKCLIIFSLELICI